MVGGKNVKSLGGEIFISERDRHTHKQQKISNIYKNIYKKRDPIKRYRELPEAYLPDLTPPILLLPLVNQKKKKTFFFFFFFFNERIFFCQ